MLPRKIEIGVGVFVSAFALALLILGIPFGVDSPETVASIELSPLFWPTILAAILLVSGIALTMRALMTKPGQGADAAEFEPWERDQTLRVGAFVVLIVVYYLAIPLLGMVWASMAAFAAMLLIVRSQRLAASVLCAVLLPLLLYLFFYHVAGVAIPQGQIVRLP